MIIKKDRDVWGTLLTEVGNKSYRKVTAVKILICSNKCSILKFEKNVEDRVRSQKYCKSDLSVNFLFFKGEKYV